MWPLSIVAIFFRPFDIFAPKSFKLFGFASCDFEVIPEMHCLQSKLDIHVTFNYQGKNKIFALRLYRDFQ
jgi:hypothetical protein